MTDATTSSEGSAELTGNVPQVVREIAVIDVKSGHEAAFERAVADAAPLFQNAHGARALSLDRSEEYPTRYRLTVTWDSIEHHLVGFRNSVAFARWRELIGDVDGTPAVEHTRNVLTAF